MMLEIFKFTPQVHGKLCSFKHLTPLFLVFWEEVWIQSNFSIIRMLIAKISDANRSYLAAGLHKISYN